jgi:uncharacterized protein
MTSTYAPTAAKNSSRLAPSTRRGLIVFAVTCAVVSGGLWFAAGVAGVDVKSAPVTFSLFALGAAGPSIAALVAVLAVRRSRAVRVRVSAPWLWAPLAIVLAALPALVAEIVLDPGSFGDEASDVLIASGGTLAFIVLYLVAGPLAEEFGWRGYLQPRLRTRYGPVGTALLVGTVWSVWHIPLFFLPGTGQHEMGLLTVNGLLFSLTTIPLSMTFLFLSERLRGGVGSAIVAHFAVNASLALFPQPTPAGGAIQLTVATAIGCGAWLFMRREPAGAPAPARE